MPSFGRSHGQRIEDLFLNRSVGKVAAKHTQIGACLRVALQSALGLSSPEKHVFAEHGIALCFAKTCKSLWRFVFLVVVIAERQCRPRAPDIAGVLASKSRKSFIRAGRGVMQISCQF